MLKQVKYFKVWYQATLACIKVRGQAASWSQFLFDLVFFGRLFSFLFFSTSWEVIFSASTLWCTLHPSALSCHWDIWHIVHCHPPPQIHYRLEPEWHCAAPVRKLASLPGKTGRDGIAQSFPRLSWGKHKDCSVHCQPTSPAPSLWTGR